MLQLFHFCRGENLFPTAVRPWAAAAAAPTVATPLAVDLKARLWVSRGQRFNSSEFPCGNNMSTRVNGVVYSDGWFFFFLIFPFDIFLIRENILKMPQLLGQKLFEKHFKIFPQTLRKSVRNIGKKKKFKFFLNIIIMLCEVMIMTKIRTINVYYVE